MNKDFFWISRIWILGQPWTQFKFWIIILWNQPPKSLYHSPFQPKLQDLFPSIFTHNEYHNLLNIYLINEKWYFIFVPTITSKTEYLFICLLSIWISYSVNCLLLFLSLFLVRLYVLNNLKEQKFSLSSIFLVYIRNLFSQWLFSSW